MRPRSFAFAVLAVAALATAAGLYTVGGPEQARRERSDLLRYRALIAVAEALACTAWRSPQQVLPAELSTASLFAYCGGYAGVRDLTLIDSETGRPFTYVRRSDSAFSICGSFHDAALAMNQRFDPLPRGLTFDPENGCISGSAR
jgi:hypothetical protein